MKELEVRKFLDVIKPDGELFEIRVIDGRWVSSGYFTDSKTAYDAIKDVRQGNIYVVFNKIKDACYGRQQRDVLLQKYKSATSDNDVEEYKWLLVDIDPVRPSDCNSSEEELKAALKVTSELGGYLKGQGFNDPLFGMSGNGYHLLYSVKITNNPENLLLIKNFLSVLSMFFSNAEVGIDTSVYSPAQLTKLLGTVSRKGTDKDVTRPQRISKLIHVPPKIVRNDIRLVQKIASHLPQPEKATYHNNYGKVSFDLDEFIRNNNIGVHDSIMMGNTRKIILSECPFDSSHRAPDSALFQMSNGAIGFKCLHNSCSHHTWKDLRLIYDPSAYDRKFDISRTITPMRSSEHKLSDVKEPSGDKFLQMKDIKRVDRSKIITIPTGITSLDNRIIGLNKGEVTLMSGSSGSGKSTFVNQMCLNAVNRGFNASVWSGELTASRMKHWMHLQAAGKQHTSQSKFSDNSYYVNQEIGEMIDRWLENKLFVYNNDYGNKFDQLLLDLEEHVRDKDISLVVLDNLMALDILMVEGDKYQQQTNMIITLNNLAKRLNIHLVLIAHPRKVVTFLRKNDISGTADLANAVDNIFIVHRINNDFVRSAADFYGTEIASRYFSFANVIEVCKNRDLGVQDEMFGVFFELESKRFLNDRYETTQYGWTEFLLKKNVESDVFYKGFEVESSDGHFGDDFYGDKNDTNGLSKGSSDDYPF